MYARPLSANGLIWVNICVMRMDREAWPEGKLNLSGPIDPKTSAFFTFGRLRLINALRIPIIAISIIRAVGGDYNNYVILRKNYKRYVPTNTLTATSVGNKNSRKYIIIMDKGSHIYPLQDTCYKNKLNRICVKSIRIRAKF
jgi:hypothetical protein